jgi:uronate dehydrogenase
MVQAALTADVRGFTVIYGISANKDAWWDLAPGRAVGYEPVDDAASVLSSVPDRPEDEVECGYLGGDYVFRSFDRRPFPDSGAEGSPA